MKKVSFVLFILVLSLALSTALVSADGETTLVVGFDQNFPPYGYVGEDGEFTGYDLELAAEAAKRLNLEVKYQPIDWDAKDMELDSGTIDLIWNGFTMEKREDLYTWTEAYKEAGQVVLVAADSGIEKLADLAGKVVAVQTDSAGLTALEDEANVELTASFKELVIVPDYNTAFMDLEAGAIDAIVMDVDVAKYQIKDKEDEYAILEEFVQKESYGVGFKLGNEALRDKVQNVLDEMAKDGFIQELSIEYFEVDTCVLTACKEAAEE